MATFTARLNVRRAALAAAALAAASLSVLVLPDPAGAYGWPVKPFDRQHPVRGFFGDPRIDGGSHSHSIHFGVDVTAPNGTPVYATLTGRVSIHPQHADTVIVSDGRGRAFEYWHVVAAVRAGEWAIAYRTVVGLVEAPWEHVHFAERSGSRYVNPLRRGALSPYADTTRPEAGAVTAEWHGRPVPVRALRGHVDLVVEVRDWMPLAAPAPWTGKPVMPAVVRWRLRGSRGVVSPWKTAFDVRAELPRSGFDGIYAKWTRQNKPWRAGRYRVYLVHGLDTTALADGAYRLEVAAADTRGNTGVARAPIVVRNHGRRPAAAERAAEGHGIPA